MDLKQTLYTNPNLITIVAVEEFMKMDTCGLGYIDRREFITRWGNNQKLVEIVMGKKKEISCDQFIKKFKKFIELAY